MATFEQPGDFSKHNTYVTLLKKALGRVQLDQPRKFVYFKDYVFADNKKLQCVLVDFSPGCLETLKKARCLPTANGEVSLTPQDELKFVMEKGRFKSIWLKKYFATMGSGIKEVWVDPNEVDDDAPGSKPFQLATPPAGKTVQPKTQDPPAQNPAPTKTTTPDRPKARPPKEPSQAQAESAAPKQPQPDTPWDPAKEEGQKQFPSGMAAGFEKQVSKFISGTGKNFGKVLDALKAVETDVGNPAKLTALHEAAQAYIEHYSKDLKESERKDKINALKLDTALLLQTRVKAVQNKRKAAVDAKLDESLMLKKWIECAKTTKDHPKAKEWATFQFAAGQALHRIEKFIDLEEKGDFENAAKEAAQVDRNIRDLKKVFAALDGDNLEQQVNQKAKDEISEDSIANTLKLNGELTTVIGMFAATSTDPGLRSIQKQCESFRTGGNQYDKAKQDVKAGKYLDAKMKVEQSNAKAAGYVGIWKKAWDPKEVGDFKQRTASKTTNEAKLAQTIGDDDYLQKMLVIKKIMEKNGFDPANLPIKIEQAVALFGYTTEDFNMLNPILRGYRPKHKKDVSDEEWEKVKKSYEVYIASINDGLAGLPAVNDWVYRGTPLDVLDKINGNSFSDKAFVSSSSTKSFLGDMQWIIESRGVGRDVAKLSLYPEGEVLFPSGTKFAVKALAAVVDAHDPDYAGITKTVKPADCYATLDALKQAVPAIASHDKVKAGKVFVVMSAG